MAAIMTALFTFLKPGDSVVYTVPIYGGTQKLIENFLSDWGVKGVAVEDLDAQTARQLGLPASTKGVVVTNVDPASQDPAAATEDDAPERH